MTPAVRLLQQLGIDHRIHRYTCSSDEDWGRAAVEALGQDPDRVFKTLLAAVDGGVPLVALVPVSARLDLRKLAAAAGGRRAVMLEPAAAERLTGYVVGGISPLGQRRRLKTWVDASARGLERIHVSGGRRGLQLELATEDLLRALDARMADIRR